MSAFEVALRRQARLPGPPARAAAFLADVPGWARLFPGVERVEAAPAYGPQAFRWTMAPQGPPGYQVRTEYVCRYTFAPDGVAWTPVPGEGNAQFRGGVALAPEGEAVRATLDLGATLELPVPAFARRLVQPALEAAFAALTDRFLSRLAEELSGRGAG
ncbi:MAG: SRPBCC family protein [Rubricoccaceae bacterium]